MLLPGETLQSQYSASPTIRALVESYRVGIVPEADIDLFYHSIFDIATAQGVGLDIWGRIVGIGRSVDVEEREDWFGFEEADYDPFNVSPFWMGGGATSRYMLSDDAYRELIMWKAMANLATADAATINRLISLLFPGQDIVIHDWGHMAIELYIWFPLLPYQRTILRNYGLLARGAGVGWNWAEIPLPAFGFAEADYEPFDSAPFWATHYTEN